MQEGIIRGNKLPLKGSSITAKSVSSTGESRSINIGKVQKSKTKAEMAHEQRMKEKRKKELLASQSKSHKQKVAEFNEKLAKLSEHHDIPKVGPG